ncbi:MAG TPA: NADH:flavin oxidoreductase [Burkholderiales bacterium]|nr:NADH:flavin oxidoreductase [Burkholderiales bacterium]
MDGATKVAWDEPYKMRFGRSKSLRLKNRVVRSSMGGRSAYYDGTVTNAWANFERQMAETGVAAIISATVDVDDKRCSPLEYPKLSDDRFMEPLARGVRAVHEVFKKEEEKCRYIMQLGDPGGHTQTSLFPQPEDGKSASWGFDFYYGYRNFTSAMTCDEVRAEVRKFRTAARRVKAIGCDGIEVTASKGYIIHQFLNPASNRRNDAYGGDAKRRFELLREVVTEIRDELGGDFLFGVRLSAKDFNYLPYWRFRFPPFRPWVGNGLEQNLEYGAQLKALGIDYLHIDSGFGFINPKGNPGTYPLEGLRLFTNSTKHLSAKARIRAAAINLLPGWLLGLGWKYEEAPNAGFAAEFRRQVGLPVIANAGFQKKETVERALSEGKCDLVAMARSLLANRDLLEHFRQGTAPEKPCSFCNECCAHTATLPLGCYDRGRFASQDEMEAEILRWSADPTPIP